MFPWQVIVLMTTGYTSADLYLIGQIRVYGHRSARESFMKAVYFVIS